MRPTRRPHGPLASPAGPGGAFARVAGRSAFAAASGLAILAGMWAGERLHERSRSPAGMTTQPAAPRAAAASRDFLLDPGLLAGSAPAAFGTARPLAAQAFAPLRHAEAPVATARLQPPAAAGPEVLAEPAVAEPAEPAPMIAASVPEASPAPARGLAVLGAPLPVPRPPEIRTAPGPEQPSRMASRPQARQARTAAAPAAPPTDGRTFLERLFGRPAASVPSTALAYAPAPEASDAPPPRGGMGSLLSRATPMASPGTAVYDISARTVYLPNGERLEAHSGLGDKMDDPRHVHVRMRGATPPHVYTLTERESLFHGVRAIRLNPVGGSRAIHGRAGLLAHTYMLGPRGDSNGCISIKDYDRFLKAYLRGEIRRLVVVAGV